MGEVSTPDHVWFLCAVLFEQVRRTRNWRISSGISSFAHYARPDLVKPHHPEYSLFVDMQMECNASVAVGGMLVLYVQNHISQFLIARWPTGGCSKVIGERYLETVPVPLLMQVFLSSYHEPKRGLFLFNRCCRAISPMISLST